MELDFVLLISSAVFFSLFLVTMAVFYLKYKTAKTEKSAKQVSWIILSPLFLFCLYQLGWWVAGGSFKAIALWEVLAVSLLSQIFCVVYWAVLVTDDGDFIQRMLYREGDKKNAPEGVKRQNRSKARAIKRWLFAMLLLGVLSFIAYLLTVMYGVWMRIIVVIVVAIYVFFAFAGWPLIRKTLRK